MGGGGPAPPEFAASVLVERDQEFAAVTRGVEALRRGSGGAILIEGAAGLGKTRLLDEAEALGVAGSAQVLSARAGRRDRDLPGAVLTRLLSRHLAGHRDRLDEWFGGAAGLSRPLLLGTAPPRVTAPFAGLHGAFWLLLNIAADGPLLLVVDDLQWCDDTTAALLAYLADRIEDTGILLVAAARPRRRGQDGEPLRALRAALGSRTLALRPLTSDGVGRILGAAGRAHDPAVSTACAEVTGGNPFYLHELLLALDRADGERDDARDGTATGAPLLTEGQVRELGSQAAAHASVSRLARCDEACVRLAEAVAVIGGPVPLGAAAALADLPPERAARAADDLATEQLIVSGAILEFSHPLIREAIYAEIPPAGRALAHAAAARLLRDAGASVNEVAAQLLLAPATGDPDVVGSLREAARSAVALGAPASAARLLHRALAEGAPGTDPVPLLIELARAENAAGLPGASEHARSALERANDPALRTAGYRILARALAADNRPNEAALALERRLDEIVSEAGSLTECPEASGTLALADYLAHAAFLPSVRQRSHARAATALLTAPDAATADGRQLLAVLAMRSGQAGDDRERTSALALEAWREGTLLADTGPDGTAWLMTVWALHLAEDFQLAADVCTAALSVAARTGSVQAFISASYFRGVAHYRHGALDVAAADADQAIEACGESIHSYLTSALVLRANVCIDRGEQDAASHALAEADSRPGLGMLEVPWRLHAHGRLALARHDPRRAAEYCEQAGSYLLDRLSAPVSILPWRTDGALAALRSGDPERARELARADLEIADTARLPVSRGRALRVLGLAAGGVEGLSVLEEAVATLAPTDAALETAQAQADLGATLRRQGRALDARAPLLDALATAERCGAGALVATVRRELEATGFRVPGSRRPDHEPLTVGQRRVAELAARGLSNVEIAQELFVTPKTVEYHLSQVYQRLQITGRRKLVAALAGTASPDRG